MILRLILFVCLFTTIWCLPWCTMHHFSICHLLPHQSLNLIAYYPPVGVFVDMQTNCTGTVFAGSKTGNVSLGTFVFKDPLGTIEVRPEDLVFDSVKRPHIIAVYQTSLTDIFLTWNGFCHENGPIDHYVVEITGAIAVSKAVGLNQSFSLGGLNLKHNDLLSVRIVANVLPHLDTLSVISENNLLRIDVTHANCPLPRVGRFRYHPEQGLICAQWLRILDEEEIDVPENPDGEAIKYWLAAGTATNLTSVFNFTQVYPETGSAKYGNPNMRFVCVGNMSQPLQASESYYVSVRSENYAGWHTNCSMVPLIPDLTPPLPGRMSVAPFVDCFAMDVKWSGFDDPESVIMRYRVGVGSRPLSDDLWSFVNTSHRTATTLRNFGNQTCLPETVVYVTVCADSTSMTTCINMSTNVDCTRPTLTVVAAGGRTGQLIGQPWFASWADVVADQYPNALSFSVAIGTVAGGIQLMPFTPVYANRTIQLPALSTVPGVTYYVSVLAVDGTGKYVVATSQGVTLDDEAPMVLLPPRLSFSQKETSSLRVDWADSFRGRQSAIASLRLTIVDVTACVRPYDSCGTTHSTAYANVSDAQQFTNLTAVNLIHGHRYACLARACNGADLCSQQFSTSVIVDVTPPLNCSIRLGLTGAPLISRCLDSPSAGFNASVQFSWSGCVDLESGIERYEVSMMDTQSGVLVAPWRNVGLDTFAAEVSVPRAAHLRQVRAVVRAFNGAGSFAEQVTSSIEVDTLLPANTLCV
eukprot:TRINITY_DN8801_c0_g1_i2.p1 TRINITY_DN8801_c0_g1~~TRINITY_DN8801_c0_g1_i2.p1  ORF type:complete len:752 (+),score=94.48 TRINITY_DN8801_c0_g1_i2:96-2351(+)